MQMRTYSATTDGLDGTLVEVEAAMQNSLPQIAITGLPGEAVKESRERVRAALGSLGFEVPTGRILIHLSPATAKKQGSQFDLAIALLTLRAESILTELDLSPFAFFGELSLDGRLKQVRGILSMVEACETNPSIRRIIIPKDNAKDVSCMRSPKIRLASHLGEVLNFVKNEGVLDEVTFELNHAQVSQVTPQFDAIQGQEAAKKALAVALAGRHHLLLIGPAGVGKSMLASSTPELLPPLFEKELLELKKIYSSVEQDFDYQHRPFRSPHHGISANALLGGGKAMIQVGEVTLSHHGVLFLDEFPEFKRDAIEGLREPLESGKIHLHRVGMAKTLASNFTLIAAMNPCPCGNAIGSQNRCTCSPEKRTAYRKRISGAILDRMGLCVVLSKPNQNTISKNFTRGNQWKEKISKAIERQTIRYGSAIQRNGNQAILDGSPGFALRDSAETAFRELQESNELSYRKMNQTLKVARTLADLEEKEWIREEHIWEAWDFRIPNLGSL